jgi:hypothetical protein
MNTITSTQLNFFSDFMLSKYGDLVIYASVFAFVFFGLLWFFNFGKRMIKFYFRRF